MSRLARGVEKYTKRIMTKAQPWVSVEHRIIHRSSFIEVNKGKLWLIPDAESTSIYLIIKAFC